jgi:hypothetical protein
MATANLNTQCSICKEETSTFICRGCSKDFCFDHLIEHRQLLNEQLHSIQDDYNQFRELIIDLKQYPEKQPLIKQIDQWENDSIIKIKQKAKECREILIHYTIPTINKIEIQLNNSSEQLIPNSKKNDFNEIHLNKLKEKLEELKDELNQSRNLSIEQQPNSFINQILIRISKFFQILFEIFSNQISTKNYLEKKGNFSFFIKISFATFSHRTSSTNNFYQIFSSPRSQKQKFVHKRNSKNIFNNL